MKTTYEIRFNPKIILAFVVAVAAFTLALRINDTRAQTSSSSGMPTSGSCAMLLTLPVPYGLTSVDSYAETGYNILGKLTFVSASEAKFNGSVVNPTYKSSGSPVINEEDTIYLRDTPVAIQAMTSTNGFEGGYKLVFSVSNLIRFNVNAIPANNSKTILLQSSGGLEPASGVCQL
jgi:hypothetical protein